MNEEFLVVVPSIRQDRPGFEEVMARVRRTFVRPTRFEILDGTEGKPAALNSALANLLPSSTAQVYVTMDDDYVPGAVWQEQVLACFGAFPQLGVTACWPGDDPHLHDVIGAHRIGPWESSAGVRIRYVERGHHIAGAMLAYRREVALATGPQPVTDEKYQIWEDAWRGRRVQSLGWRLGFVDAGLPEFVHYDDPSEYDEWRKEQIQLSRQNQDFWLKDSGIPDPISLRIRRWIAKIRGRAQ